MEYGLYAFLPLHSWLDLLKQCNLFSFLDTERFFKSYGTINLFGYPVSSVLVCSAAGAALLAVSVLVVLGSYERVSQSEYMQKSFGVQIKKRIRIRRKRRNGHSLLFYEGYKLLWVSGAGIILAGFLVLQLAVSSGEKVYFTLDELYYKHYMQKLEGEVTEEKLDFIRREAQRIAGLNEERQNLASQESGISAQKLQGRQLALDRQLLCETAFERIKEQAERIGRKGVFLNEVGYAYLLDKRQQVQQLQKLLPVWILAFHSAFIAQKTAGMHSLWNTVPDGKNKIQKRKWLLLAGSIILLCAASDLIFILYRMKSQSLASVNIPLQYLPGFHAWKHASAGGYLTALCILKILAGIIVCRGMEKISERAKNATTVLLLAGSLAGVCCLIFNSPFLREFLS